MTAPRTIEEFQAFCAERNMPLEKMRFFIGVDYKQPRAFGIYACGDGTFVVYKNKDDGSRSIRYNGTDEAEACAILFDKMVSEIEKRGLPIVADLNYPETIAKLVAAAKKQKLNLNKLGFAIGENNDKPNMTVICHTFDDSFVVYQNDASGFRKELYNGYEESEACRIFWKQFSLAVKRQKKKIEKRNKVITFLLIIAVFALIIYASMDKHRTGYYVDGDDVYYCMNDNWYYFSDGYWYDYGYDWVDDYYWDDPTAYYYGEDYAFYDDDWEFENSYYYQEYQESHNSSSSSDYDSWDSSDTDWGSDW